jgi:hypothetical protein
LEFGEVMTDDNKYWQEIFRILQVASNHSGEDLLEECLNGRQQTTQTVTQLFKLARLHFETGGIVSNKLCEACLTFLEANLSFDELQKLKNPEPSKHSILDEMEAEGRY